MKLQKCLLCAAIIGALGATSLMSSSVLLAATPTAKEAGMTQAQQNSFIRTMDEASKAIREIRMARVALFNGEPQISEELAAAARKDLETARKAKHVFSVLTHRESADGDAYIPFDTTVSLAEGFVPDETKTRALQKANEHLAKGEQSHAAEALKLANIDVSIAASMIPVTSSIEHVDAATKLMKEKKYYEANLSLKAVEDSAITETYGLDAIPLQGQGS